MKKNLSAAAVVFFSAVMYSQVGVNNTTPKATLDITAKTTDGSKPEGLIAPRLTGDQIKAADAQYGSDQKGAIIYATAGVTSPSTKTADITAEGYYYFDGSLWKKMLPLNSASNGLTATNSDIRLGGSLTGATAIGDITAAKTFSFRAPSEPDAVITVGTPGGTSGGVLFGNGSHGVKRGFPVTGANNNVGFFTAGGDVYMSSQGPVTGEFILSDRKVGINSMAPKATLDVAASSTDGGRPEGFIAPRLTGDQIKAGDSRYNTDQKGAIIYATAGVTSPSTKTANITAEGYYYFDGSLWQKISQTSTTNTLTETNGNLVSTVNGVASTPAVPILALANNGLTATNGNVKLGGDLTGNTVVSNITGANRFAFRSPDASASDAIITVGTTGETSGGVLFGNPNHGVKRGFPTTGENNNVGLFTTNADVHLSTQGAATGEFILKKGGNVGIGTNTPDTRLAINGQIMIMDGQQDVGKVLVSDADGRGTWGIYNQNSFHTNMVCNASTDIQLDQGQDYTLPGFTGYVCQSTGKYQIILHTFFTISNATPGNRSFYFRIIQNGNLVKNEEIYIYTDANGQFAVHFPLIVSANAGDNFAFEIRPTIGAPFTLEAGLASRNHLDVMYIGK